MSSPTSNNTWSNTSAEGAATASTNYSPDLERAFGNLNVGSNVTGVRVEDPFTTQVTQPNEADDTASFNDIVERICQGGPMQVMTERQHGGTDFGTAANGNPLSCFVFVRGDHSIQDYHRNGQFGPILQYKSIVNCVVEHRPTHPSKGNFMGLLRFDDSRDAEKAISAFNRLGNPEEGEETFMAKAITAKQYCALFPFIANPGHLFLYDHGIPALKHMPETFSKGYDGQFLVQVEAQPARGVELSNDDVFEITKEALSCTAEIKVMSEVLWEWNEMDQYPNVRAYLVELFVQKQADVMVDIFQGYCHYYPAHHPCQALTMWASHFEEKIFDESVPAPEPSNMLTRQTSNRHLNYPTSRNNMFGVRGNAQFPVARGMAGGPRTPVRDRRLASPHDVQNLRAISNMVNWGDVMRGCDTRTTFMLRNIPSELNFHGFKYFLDHFVKFKYDFLYLRVDFSTNKNLGYGFINLDKPTDILSFLEACVGELWPVVGTSKRVEVSYANVQTIPQIIEKFRNSSVMLEAPIARPKLFYLEGHPRAGEERPFPGVDNDQKQIRSSQNMRAFGLYRGGRVQRHQGRLDRGNPNSPTDSEYNRDRMSIRRILNSQDMTTGQYSATGYGSYGYYR